MRERGTTRPFVSASVVALAAHGALVALVVRAPSRPVGVVGGEATPLEVEMIAPTSESAAPPGAVVMETTGRSDVPPRRAVRSRIETPTEAPTAAPEGRATSPFATTGADEAAPRRPVSFTLPWGSVDARSAETAPPPPAEDANEKVRRSLLVESEAKDRELGTGVVGRIGGRIASVAAPAVRRAGAPDGWALVDVDLDETGHARSVSLASSSVAGFAVSADAVREALATQTIALPPGFHGARVRIKIVSRVRLASGQKSALDRSNLFTPSDEPGQRVEPKEGMLHERWWKEALPGLPVWKKIQTTPTGVKVVPLLEWDPSNLGTAPVSTVAVTVLEVVPR